MDRISDIIDRIRGEHWLLPEATRRRTAYVVDRRGMGDMLAKRMRAAGLPVLAGHPKRAAGYLSILSINTQAL